MPRAGRFEIGERKNISLYDPCVTGDFAEESGTAAAHELLVESVRADAPFAANDMMAIGALVASQRAGLTVPDDIADIGAEAVSRAAAILAAGIDTAIRVVTPQIRTRASTVSVTAEAPRG